MTDLLSNPNTASVPAHVREAVLDRMKLLRQRDRSIVMFASVIGGRFDVALLSAAAGYAPDEARGALEEACSLQILEAEGDSDCYWFRHALTLLYNERAGDLATAVFAGDVARMYYERALGCLPVGSAEYTRLAEKMQHAHDHSADRLPAVHRPG